MNAASPPNSRALQAAPLAHSEGETPRPSWAATGTALFGVTATAVLSSGQLPSQLAHQAALGVLLSLVASLCIEARAGLRNVIRADLLAIVAFYYLTLFEFLFRQPVFDTSTSLGAASSALLAVYLGFASLLIARHVPRPKRLPFARYLQAEMSIGKLLLLFWVAVILGYFYMLACSEWNPLTMLAAMAGPRFSQPWSRGQLGDWRSIFTELSLLLYLIPALAGVVLARPERYRLHHLLPILILLLVTLYQGFATGTRNIFGAYLVNFLVGFAFASSVRRRNRVLALSLVTAAAMGMATYVMLQFREWGLRNWLRGDYTRTSNLQSDYVFVDYNLLTIATMTNYYPKRHPFLGMEIPYLAIIRPIPRFLWPGKPTGMSQSIEQIMGYDEGVTISATFVGEAYISGGYWAIVFVGLILGAINGWWSLMASARNSELGILVYASGFFSAVITMRSLFAFTTAVLPTLVCLLVVILLVSSAQAGGRKVLKLLRHQAPRPIPRNGGGRAVPRVRISPGRATYPAKSHGSTED